MRGVLERMTQWQKLGGRSPSLQQKSMLQGSLLSRSRPTAAASSLSKPPLLQAEVAREVLALAGFADPSRVQVLGGLSSDVLPRLAEELPAGPARRAGVVFLDHCKPCYRPDLQVRFGLLGGLWW